jgi:hypothetical protein
VRAFTVCVHVTWVFPTFGFSPLMQQLEEGECQECIMVLLAMHACRLDLETCVTDQCVCV